MPTLAAYAYRTSMGLPVVRPKKKLQLYEKLPLYDVFKSYV
jgi:citrate synthase